MSAMAATSGSSQERPNRDYLAGQLSDGPFDAEFGEDEEQGSNFYSEETKLSKKFGRKK